MDLPQEKYGESLAAYSASE